MSNCHVPSRRLVRADGNRIGMLALAALLAAAALGPADRAPAAEPPAKGTNLLQAKPEALEAWKDLRFGLFIHWGPVTLKGKEISLSRGDGIPIPEYDRLYQQFNPTNFNADDWAKVARDAGAKYLVLTAKHHDGFCLWDTKQTNYNIMHTPFGRDVTKELAAACRAQGIRFGAYYSVCDWHHPDYPLDSPMGYRRKPKPNMPGYVAYFKNQVTELVTNYGPLCEIWFDIAQEFYPADGKLIISLARSLQPDILMNDRCPGGGDYDTPEQTHGSFNMEQPWEAAITLCTQWAWKPNDSMKSLDQCLGLLIACAGRNGNLLFNTGPMPDGRIEPRQAERLREMGAWLAKYGVSIYGTRGGPFRNGRYGVSTRKDKTIYLHVLNWTPDTLEFPAIPARIVASSALTGGKPTVKQTDDGIEVFLPPGDRQKPDTIVALELDRPALELPSQWVQAWKRSLTFGKLASASSAAKGQAADKALDRVEKTSWAADAGAKQAWLEVNLGKPETITRAEIVETHPGRVQRFELQAKDGEEWKTFHAGTNLGANCSLTFAPVTAQFVRLNLPAAAAGPAITEFHLFAK